MKISTRGQYSLDALLYLAVLPNGKYASIKKISENTHISSGYLEQLFIPLKKAGIVKGVRGALGGYYIAKPLQDISVADILHAVEGTLEPVNCIKSIQCPAEPWCISRHTWGILYQEIQKIIKNITLKDLAFAFSNATYRDKGEVNGYNN